MQIRAAAPPNRKLPRVLTKFVLLGQKYIWPEPDRQDLYLTNGKRPFTQGLRDDSRPLVAEFGSSTWYKYSASLRKSSLA